MHSKFVQYSSGVLGDSDFGVCIDEQEFNLHEADRPSMAGFTIKIKLVKYVGSHIDFFLHKLEVKFAAFKNNMESHSRGMALVTCHSSLIATVGVTSKHGSTGILSLKTSGRGFHFQRTQQQINNGNSENENDSSATTQRSRARTATAGKPVWLVQSKHHTDSMDHESSTLCHYGCRIGLHRRHDASL